ncbi:MAG: hypothetical protein FWC48_00170 [Actinomycetia bacterium]|nr:hypothetical protein [Actinomycetes bacterium]
MKRVFIIALTLVVALLLALALAGCGKKQGTSSDRNPAGTSSQQGGTVKSNTVETEIAP